MSLASKISIIRILLAPAIVAALVYYHPARDGLRVLALSLFLVGMASDALDGWIARAARQHSQLGALLDPIADKTLILSALITCASVKGLPEWMQIPAWFIVIVISRDALVIVGSSILFSLRGRWEVHPDVLGKVATAAQMCVVPIVLLGWPLKPVAIGIAALLTVASAGTYLRRGVRLLN